MPFLWTHSEPAEDSIFGQKYFFMAISHPKGHFARSHKTSLPVTFIHCLLYQKWELNPFWWDSMGISHGVCTSRSAGFLIGNCSICWCANIKDSWRPVTNFTISWVSLALSHHLSHTSTLFNCYFILDTFTDIWHTILLLPLLMELFLNYLFPALSWAPDLMPDIKGLFYSHLNNSLLSLGISVITSEGSYLYCSLELLLPILFPDPYSRWWC